MIGNIWMFEEFKIYNIVSISKITYKCVGLTFLSNSPVRAGLSRDTRPDEGRDIREI
jgi:hypothetical protein